ncbi:neutral/alkaline non-lysosomal ceramidase N-terminal domain-containing protein [Cohnella sp. JJ-181]|uniref:neutral/alkaline non-lysosomal ceramidase N-terminal domain-containing protein n=1 Tax=Cohnella rhizoplanae TaxID=2974897 RepID=UPI0022FF712F|nr:neutral/alkaline non-lysosomal ceramidase N-terminal domain-containing protein [Cohnella sp. JJ-181]CAI6025192.1 hypothetical protein COHCIP112018_00476 [Cohnella sp. JJ-181]
MKFGISKAEITPRTPVFMAGFADRTHESEGVHDPLYAKAVLLQANKTLAIITLDLVGSDRSFIDGITSALENRFGLRRDEVLINFSHTHHAIAARGPVQSEFGAYRRGSVIDFTMVLDTLLTLVSDCYDRLEEGRLWLARGTSRFGVSRRKLTEQGVQWKPAYDTEIDHDLFVLKLVDGERQVRGILYNYGCHPTSMSSDNYLISNDYPGKTSSVLEETYPGATAFFLQGCAGEIKPMKSASGDDFISCTVEQMEEAGAELARAVIQVMEASAFSPIQGPFRTMLTEATLRMERTPVEHFEGIANDPAIGEARRRGAARKIEQIEKGFTKEQTSIYIAIWHLDDATRLIALEGEISTEYAMLLKQLFPGGKTIVLGYSNGVSFYVPTRKMIAEGGYEVDFHPLGGPFSGIFFPEIEDVIVGQIAKADLSLRLAGSASTIQRDQG